MTNYDYWELVEEDLVAPGWSLREGYACGPAAEGASPNTSLSWITAPDYEEVVWRTWCALFGDFHVQDGDVHVWPPKPDDWKLRIRRAQLVWRRSQVQGRGTLQERPR